MIKLATVYGWGEAFNKKILYNLLKERTPDQSISHRGMPSWHQHLGFVDSHPYECWYMAWCGDDCVGSVYLTKEKEIGIFIFNKYQGRGYGREIVQKLIHEYPGDILANINPKNEVSINLFKGLGFKHIQNTYALRR